MTLPLERSIADWATASSENVVCSIRGRSRAYRNALFTARDGQGPQRFEPSRPPISCYCPNVNVIVCVLFLLWSMLGPSVTNWIGTLTLPFPSYLIPYAT